MSYPTILVHVDLSVHAPARMRYAAALAHAHGAHLVGAAMFGIAHDVFPHGYDTEPGTLAAGVFQPLADNARRALSRFESIARDMHVPHASHFVCDQADQGLALLARFADLVVVSQDDPNDSLPEMATRLPEFLILNCARPVLVLPYTDPAPYHNPRVLVAWDGSKEASSAMRASIPLLRRTSTVTVAILTGPGLSAEDFHAQQPELLRFLARHHVTPRILVREAQHDSGQQLLALANELGCGLLVMGCYGHSRFRELCLGGASRTVLAESDIPLLLAH
jgi:nucleotide-binding universal stress UspA family protein